jgi:acyl-CoA synthetase (NDP forming)
MNAPAFFGEAEAYRLVARAGIAPPRHGFIGENPPFRPGERIVLKGLGDGLWHKSELGAVQFAEFAAAALARSAADMRRRVEAAGHRWLGGLVCERIAIARAEGLPAEALVSLSRHEAGWIALVGCGGLQAEALGARVPPLQWPLALMTPAEALAEFEAHLLGQVWLGSLRGTKPLTTRGKVQALLESLWKLAALAEDEGLSLLEMNPVALDATGEPRPLDAAGRREERPPLRVPPPEFLPALENPRRVALAGVSAQEGGVGRTILENLFRCPQLAGNIVLIKPGVTELFGVPCVADVGALQAQPADLLILALPAPAAAKVVGDLLGQGGGAKVVCLVAGGLGDGADTAGLGAQLATQLRAAREAGCWTPAVLGPNFLGHWVPAAGLDTSFIPAEKLAPPARPGPLALLGQSGAFLLCRRSRNPELRLALGVALGNQLDVALPDFLHALADDPHCRAVAAYAEGFGPGHLAATVQAARKLRARGVTLLLHRAGRTAAGQAAAASHTGALAGDLALERAMLERAGVKFSPTIAAFDAALAWLGAWPRWTPGPVALLTNAGFESVNGSDLADARLPLAQLAPEAVRELEAMLAEEKLAGLVVPRLPLDLTPMARESAFLRAAALLLRGDAAALVVGLVPFTRNLATPGGAARNFAAALAGLARESGKPVGVAVDAGGDYEEYRAAFSAAGLPVFTRVEEAWLGLATLAQGGAGAMAPMPAD